MSNEGKFVRVTYTGTFDDGTVFDSTESHGGDPLEFVCMAGMMIPGFDQAVKDMTVGETATVHIPCAQAYGERSEDMVQRFPSNQVPNVEWMTAGQSVYLSGPDGRPIPAKVMEVTQEFVTIDMNHEMAGKDLNFEITLVEALDQNPE